MNAQLIKTSVLALTACLSALSSGAQNEARPWVAELNINAGFSNQSTTVYTMGELYPVVINSQSPDVKYSAAGTFGFTGQVGYFFGRQRKFGIGAGLSYFSDKGNLRADKFHVEYQATDFKNDVFRQLITGNGSVKEEVNFSTLGIPVVAKFRHGFAKKWIFNADAGIVYNVYNRHTGSSEASFDYEAVYKFVQTGSGIGAVYDPAPIPGEVNWLITKAHYEAKNPDGNAESYFTAREAEGYTVGLNKKSTYSGTRSYKSASVGFIIQPSIGVMLTDKLALNLGLYCMAQTFKNDLSGENILVDNKRNLSSLSAMVQKNTMAFYGCNVGIRLHFGK